MPKAVDLALELEKLANHYRDLGDATVNPIHCLDFHTGKESFLNAVAQMPHPFSKVYKGDDFAVVYRGAGVVIEHYAKRDRVCRIVEPAKPAVYECEPLLSPAEVARIEASL